MAPTNTAFNGLAANATTDATLLGDRLAYHLLSGSFPGSAFATSPNHTIARTYLNDTNLVHLEGGRSQVIAFNIDGGATRVLNQNTQVTITDTASYQNLLIQIVDAVVDVPGTITAAFATWQLSALSSALTSLNFTTPLEAARGITVFAPNDAAIQSAQSTLSTLNTTTLASVLANHVINGTTVYSPLLTQGTYTSAAGAGFTFASNGSGIFVTSGNATARVVQSDIILENGVMHIIDTVLYNNHSDPGAASSAYNAYTSTAGQGAQQTGGVGSGPTPTETGPIGRGSQSAGILAAPIGGAPIVQAIALLAGVLAGTVLLI